MRSGPRALPLGICAGHGGDPRDPPAAIACRHPRQPVRDLCWPRGATPRDPPAAIDAASAAAVRILDHHPSQAGRRSDRRVGVARQGCRWTARASIMRPDSLRPGHRRSRGLDQPPPSSSTRLSQGEFRSPQTARPLSAPSTTSLPAPRATHRSAAPPTAAATQRRPAPQATAKWLTASVADSAAHRRR